MLFLLAFDSSISAQNISSDNTKVKFTINEQFFSTDKLILSSDSLRHKLSLSQKDSILIASSEHFFVNSTGLFARSDYDLDYEATKIVPILISFQRNNILKIDTLFLEILNVNEPPIFTIFEPEKFIAENAETPIFVGRFSAIDPDSLNEISYSLSLKNKKFNASEYSVKNDSILIENPEYFNYETNNSLSFILDANDGFHSTTRSFTINLTNVPESPTAILNTNTRIRENSAYNSVIDTIKTLDEDLKDVLSLQLDSKYLSINRIDNKTFTLSIADSTFFNYEQNSALKITALATDNTNKSIERTLTYSIENINESPILKIDSLVQTYEDEAVSVRFEVSDPETPNNELIYSLHSNNSFLLRDIDYGLTPLPDSSYELLLNPVHNASGTANLVFSVSDQILSDSAKILLEVEAINDVSSIKILPIKISESDTYLFATQNIKISDVDNLPTDIQIKIERFPTNGSLFFGDSLISEIDFELNYFDIINNKLAYRHDGNESLSDTIGLSFTDRLSEPQFIDIPLTIKPMNDPPYFVTNFFPIYTSEADSSSFRFIVNDTDNVPTDLKIRVSSSNTSIIKNADIVVQGIDFYRTLSFKTQPNSFGNAPLEIELSDGDKATTKTLDVVVKPINDAPSMVASVKLVDLIVGTSKEIEIAYYDSDSEPEALSLSIGSTNNRVLSDENFDISHNVEQSQFTIKINTKDDITGDGLLLIELSDESKATALQIPFNVQYGNRKPLDFQLLSAEPFLRNDSLLVEFSWSPSEDPDGKEVNYAVFIQNDKRDTVISGLSENTLTFRNNRFLSPISTYTWHVKATDNGSQSSKSNYIDSTLSLNPGSFVTPNFTQVKDWVDIDAIYPNPFNSITRITYQLKYDAQIEIAMYDLSGRKVDVVTDDFVTKGTYDNSWQPQNATSGLYICRITARRLIDGETLRVSKSVTYLPQ